MMDCVPTQAVLSELGGSDNAGTGHHQYVHTPSAGPQTPLPADMEVYHTPSSAVQQSTPIDAWHSIISTLTGEIHSTSYQV